jgi:Tfp pilus assembly protein PilO
MKEFILQLNSKSLRNLGMLLIAGIILGGSFISINPIVRSISERNAETAGLNAELTQTTAKISEYSAMEGKKTELDDTRVYLMEQFPETSNNPSLIQDINDAAIAAGLSANLINNVNFGTPTTIVIPGANTGQAVCGSLASGEFAKIIPDLKNSTEEEKVYIMCTEDPLKGLPQSAFYNAATDENAARECRFDADASSGKLFYIKVKCRGGVSGTILPALYQSSVNVEGLVGKYPAKAIIAQVTGEVKQMSLSISLDNSVQVETLSRFVDELYKMGRVISISSIKVGISGERNEITYTVINGFAYSHTAIISGDSVNTGGGN